MLNLHDSLSHRETHARDAAAFRHAVYWSLGFVALLWWIKTVEVLFGRELGVLGVVPGSWLGLIGVITAPFIHGSWAHVLSNSLPLLVMGSLGLYAHPKALYRAIPFIWLVSGLGTWFIGRPSSHIGASGIAHGLMFMLFTLGVLRWEPRSIAVALVTFLLYGSMLLTVLPREEGVSWEYHLCGALAGLMAAVFWRQADPPAPKKKYSWDLEEELAELQTEMHANEFEPARPESVPILWTRPTEPSEVEDNVVAFPQERVRKHRGTLDDEPPTQTRH
jgi:membrane associated rhomboid family serine protease